MQYVNSENGPMAIGPYLIDDNAGTPRMYTMLSPTPEELAQEIAAAKAKEQEEHIRRDDDGAIHIDSLADLPVNVLVNAELLPLRRKLTRNRRHTQQKWST